MSVPMALMDMVPVVLFFLASLSLMHDLYHMMSKGAFALFAAGVILVSVAGFYKALWKMLYALNVCDFEALNRSFFPMQSTGFILAGIGMVGLLFFRQSERTAAMAVVPVYSSAMPFVMLTLIGTFCIWGALAVIAKRMRQSKTAVLFVFSFVCMLGMGYLSSRDFTEPLMNWIGQSVNLLGTGTFLIGARILHKAGLDRFEMA